jgi:GTP-binding protein EngB required for normal cell division
MNTMRCEQCGRFVDGKPCPFCQSTRVRPLNPGEQPWDPLDTQETEPGVPVMPRLTDAPSIQPAKAEPADEPRPVVAPSLKSAEETPRRETPLPFRRDVEVEPVRRERPRPVPAQSDQAPPAPAPVPAAKAPEIRNLAEFEALLTAEKFESIVICGLGNSGKSEIASGFTRANMAFRQKATISTMRASSGVAYSLGGTAPGEVWFEILNTRRKLVFLDPSGEFFQKISPSERQRLRLPDITPEYFQFVRVAVKRLAGIVLVVDLTRTLDDMAESPWQNQELDLAYTLGALRWLRHDKAAAVEQLGVTSLIASRLLNLPRLDVPVLVLFSKADKLGELTNKLPSSFARNRLTTLYGAVHSHARRYRFDFVSTMHVVNGVDRQAPRPCGVLLPMEWLVSNPFRWMPSLPTRFLQGGS